MSYANVVAVFLCKLMPLEKEVKVKIDILHLIIPNIPQHVARSTP
jgi:hypothetical protein